MDNNLHRMMLAVASCWMFSASLLVAQEAAPRSAKALASSIGNGINLDVAHPHGFPREKIAFDPAQCDSIAAAGFRTVRFFISPTLGPETLRPRIDAALERKLTVVICLWGRPEWATDPDGGINAFVTSWKQIATELKGYSNQLVFELLNEPGALRIEDGKPTGISDGTVAMAYLNAAIPAIREIAPERPLAIGGPGLNEGRNLEKYVIPQYLRYRLPDGTGFAEDRNIVGVFHMYEPYGFSHWTKPLSEIPDWKARVSAQFEHATSWSQKWKKAVMLSEWGAWKPPSHTEVDFKEYLSFVTTQCRDRRIISIYYCAGFNDTWKFNILNSDGGWHDTALESIIGSEGRNAVPLRRNR